MRMLQHMFDTVAGVGDVNITPWIIIDGKAAGYIHNTACASSGSENAVDIFKFYKTQGFRSALLAAAPFEKQ